MSSSERTRPVPDKSVFSWQNVAISILGGAAAGVIFAVVVRGGFNALIMALVAPLPIMIVALGFGVLHGATAAILPTVALSVWHPVAGMLFGLLVALPGWLAAYAVSGAPRDRRDLLTANLPAWGVLAPAAALATAAILWLVIATISFGSLDEALSEVQGRIWLMLDALSKEKDFEGKFDPKQLSGLIARAVPAAVATYALIVHTIDLWLAGRLAQGSGLLSRPWPDIAMDFRLPRPVGAVFAAGLVLSVFSGPVGPIGMVLSSTTSLLLAFQGLAVIHVYLRGSKSSALILSVLYFVVGVLSAYGGFPILLLAALGVFDLVFNYRQRFTAAATPDPQKTD